MNRNQRNILISFRNHHHHVKVNGCRDKDCVHDYKESLGEVIELGRQALKEEMERTKRKPKPKRPRRKPASAETAPVGAEYEERNETIP